MDYDLAYLSTPDVLLIWNSVNYTSLAAFKSATGQETHGSQADPKWASPVGGDFHLTAGSPGIDSANSGASGQPSADAEGNPRLDGWGAHGHRQRRRGDCYRLAERERRQPRPSRALPGFGHDHGGRLAGLHGRGARPVRELARRRDRLDELLDHPGRVLHRRE